MHDVGLVLSGGGVRGVAHLGVIKALEENDVHISAISGASAGAIIGTFYAAGFSVERILEIITEIKTARFLQLAMSWKGVLKMDAINKFISKHLKEDTFESLKIPLYAAATNIKTGKTTYFDKGPLVPAICASSCIPVLFDPVAFDGQLYVDGGILNNLPVEPIREKCALVIASHSNPVDSDYDAKNAKDVMERSLMMAITCNVYSRRHLCDYFIEPAGLEEYKVLDINKAEEIFKIGYQEAITYLEHSDLKDRL
ncbi:patatin-like phospholipase family protein [Fulvivirga sp. M361]|uniref:patatin-like phospholipase family protein n=1 Tax=Fulvivirga sp. M361 TaxID=2594266 RepID=UPI00117AAC57|nr:patatin-like phospholipase family protein [Fulvivirga sp. M361]TRX59571.1 patatin-like phospholipase family protein [Fulvivirga sp. M361]